MNTSVIKSVTEKNLNSAENKSEKEIEILFERQNKGKRATEKITLSGTGSIKVLLPV